MIVFSKKLRAKLRNYFRFLRFDGDKSFASPQTGAKPDLLYNRQAIATQRKPPSRWKRAYRTDTAPTSGERPPCEEAGRTPRGGPDSTCRKVPEYSAASTRVLCAEYCDGLRTATPHSVRMLRMGFSRATWRHWNQTVSSVMPPIRTKAARKSHQWMGVL